MSDKRKVPAWKILAVLAAVGVFLVGGIVFVIHRRVSARWVRFGEDLKALAWEVRAQGGNRPVLRGSATPGNAWTDYAKAESEVLKIQGRTKFIDLIQRTPKADPAWAEAMLRMHGALLEDLKAGASRTDARSDYQWELGMDMPLAGPEQYVDLAAVAVLKARALAREGKSREAVGLLLDALQYGRDIADGGPLMSEVMGMGVLSYAMDGVRDLLETGAPDAAALADLDHGLEVLDGSYPSYAQVLRRELLGIGMSLAAGNFGQLEVPERLSMWRYGFSSRIMMLDSYDRVRDAFEQGAQLADAPWLSLGASTSRIDHELRSSPNPVLPLLTTGLLGNERLHRERRTQLRLLRVATLYRRTGSILDLEDPLGTKIRTQLNGTVLKAWSAGRDGIDDGGVGVWKPESGKDVVIEVPK